MKSITTEFGKSIQIARTYPLYRDHERLWAHLGLKCPESIEESQNLRYGKCANPRCVIRGTRDRPLDLHHIVPRSQSVLLRDDIRNHLYVCGDFSGPNHHKALHGEATPGRKDWLALSVFEMHAPEKKPVDNALLVERLLSLASRDHIAGVLLKRDPLLLLGYASSKGVVDSNSVLSGSELGELHEWSRKRQTH